MRPASRWLRAAVMTEAEWLASAFSTPMFELLPDLAEALEQAGCSDPDLLGHCRQPGEHIEGCWALDLLLNEQ